MYICSLNVDNNAMASILCFNCRGLTGDFESAMWTAATEIFGAEVELRGCLFHWNQAIYRRIQDSGLQKGFHTKRGVNSFCKLIMALPFLPAEWIEPVQHSSSIRRQWPSSPGCSTTLKGSGSAA